MSEMTAFWVKGSHCDNRSFSVYRVDNRNWYLIITVIYTITRYIILYIPYYHTPLCIWPKCDGNRLYITACFLLKKLEPHMYIKMGHTRVPNKA